jgi:hypothetical protein
MNTRALLIMIVSARLALPANPPIANVSTSQGVWINKVKHAGKGIPSWPLVQGDEIRTGSEEAVVSAPDGSRYVLAKNARVRVFHCSAGFVLQVLEGEVEYKIAPGAKVELCSLGHPIQPAESTEGSVTVDPPEKVTVHTGAQNFVDTSGSSCPCVADSDSNPTPGWLASHKVVILVIAGTLAAVGTTLGLTLPGPTSPSVPGQ